MLLIRTIHREDKSVEFSFISGQEEIPQWLAAYYPMVFSNKYCLNCNVFLNDRFGADRWEGCNEKVLMHSSILKARTWIMLDEVDRISSVSDDIFDKVKDALKKDKKYSDEAIKTHLRPHLPETVKGFNPKIFEVFHIARKYRIRW